MFGTAIKSPRVTTRYSPFLLHPRASYFLQNPIPQNIQRSKLQTHMASILPTPFSSSVISVSPRSTVSSSSSLSPRSVVSSLTFLTSVDRHRHLTGGPLQGSFEYRQKKGKKSFCAGTGDVVELDPFPVLTSTDVAPLKLKLLNAVAGLNKGFAANKEDLKTVESIAKELESAGGPVDLTCNSEMLQGRWKLIYSSAFSSGTLGGSRPGPPTGRLLPITLGKVFQRIDVLSKDFDNIVEVEFGTPWPLPKVEAIATLAYKFELIGSSQIKIVFVKTTVNPTGNLAQIPPIELPRLPDGLKPPSSGSGEGDFEVTYLDVDTRVTRGDRGELRVFVIS